MFLYSTFYSLFINYILIMIFKIFISNTSTKRKHYIKLFSRGILLFLFFGFYFLNNYFKDFYCIFLLALEAAIIFDFIREYLLQLKIFYIEESIGKEEYFSFSFSLRNLFCILYMYFLIDILIKSYVSNSFFLSFVKKTFFNFILEGLLLSLLSSIVFVLMQQFINYKNNFIIYQNLSYSLKSIYAIINNFDYKFQIKTKEIPSYNLQFYTLKNENIPYQKIVKDFLKKELNYIIENKSFFINRFSKLELEEIIKKTNAIISTNEYDDTIENNIILSKKIYIILEDLRKLKKNPIKYILNNY